VLERAVGLGACQEAWKMRATWRLLLAIL